MCHDKIERDIKHSDWAIVTVHCKVTMPAIGRRLTKPLNNHTAGLQCGAGTTATLFQSVLTLAPVLLQSFHHPIIPSSHHPFQFYYIQLLLLFIEFFNPFLSLLPLYIYQWKSNEITTTTSSQFRMRNSSPTISFFLCGINGWHGILTYTCLTNHQFCIHKW